MENRRPARGLGGVATMTRGEIILAHPIGDFLRKRGAELKSAGQNFVTNACPKTPHKKYHCPVSIDTGKNVFHCNDCDVGGSVIDWVAIEENVTAVEAMRKLARGRNRSEPITTRKLVETYNYVDENGELLFQNCR